MANHPLETSKLRLNRRISDCEIHAPPPKNRRSTSRVQKMGVVRILPCSWVPLGKETIHHPVAVRISSLLKKTGPTARGKVSVIDMVSQVFTGLCIHHWPGKFYSRPEKLSKRSSFGGGRVRFLLPCFDNSHTTPPNLEDRNLLK